MKIDKNLRTAKNEAEIRKNVNSFYNEFKHLSFPDWYGSARDEIKDLNSGLLDLPLELACMVVSILSPANRWESNLRDFEIVCTEAIEAREIGGCSTYPANVLKAHLLLGEYLDEREAIEHYISFGVPKVDIWAKYSKKYLKTPKVLNFWLSLVYGLGCCIDRHIIRCCGIDYDGKFPTAKQYEFIQSAFLSVFFGSPEIMLHFGSPANFQAFIWQSYVFKTQGINHY